jgi:hypothetical protein
MLWQRRKTSLNNDPYHLPNNDNTCGHEWHYFSTLCRKEIVGHNWDIKENPDKKECCKGCLIILKQRKKIVKN